MKPAIPLTRTIAFGALAPPLAKQLPKGYAPRVRVATWQAYADAITLLRVTGLLGEGDAFRAHQRLLRRIEGNR